MSGRPFFIALLMLAPAGADALAQAPAAPAGDSNPLLCLEAGGPTAAVTALAFSPDGRTLYAAGYDKVVRVWKKNPGGADFQLDPRATARVPIGPGRDGVINVLAASPDGKWLAVSGLGVYRGGSGFGQEGRIVPDEALSRDMRQERYLIYLFDTETRAVALLRGHEEFVAALAFAPAAPGQPVTLVSVGRRPGDQPGSFAGRVCVWDVGKAAVLNDKGELEDRGAKRHEWTIPAVAVPAEATPGLAVRFAAEGQARAAVAWGDGKLRVWEFGPTGAAAYEADEPRDEHGGAAYTHTVAARPGGWLTGGGLRGSGGYVQAWQDAAGQAPRVGPRVRVEPPPGGRYALPRAFAPVVSGAGPDPDHAAVVVRSDAGGGRQQYYLCLLDINTLRFVNRAGTDTAVAAGDRPPVAVPSPDGRLLAVTGGQNREVRVYAASDLAGRRPAAAPLRSVGATAAAVAFGRKGDAPELGLLLGQSRPAAPGQPRPPAADDLVLDFAKRSLTADPARQGWRAVSPADAGWRVTRDAAVPHLFHWAGPQAARGSVALKLKPSQAVTSYALIPPPKPLAVPVLAVATWDGQIGEPLLALYHGGTGQRLRQLTGHVQPVHSLAATPDGRLLASAAEDQTVCLWSLADLPGVVGQHATLPGVAFRPTAPEPVIDKVEPGSPAEGALAAGDVVKALSFGPGGQPRPVASPLDVYEAVWREKPGGTVKLDIERQGAARTVGVVLGQGVDERKPLLSLFVTRDAPPEWVAWTPLGPYDASGREAERYVGWHFNPPRLGGAVRFARADAYRERLNKPGLLKALLAHGNLADALRELDKPVSLPKPTLILALGDAAAVPNGQAEQVLVRDPRVTFRLKVGGPSLARNEVESVTWQVNDGEPHPMPLAAARGEMLSETVDLKERGVYRVKFRLRTREAEPQVATRELVLRYQPPPPHIRIDSPVESQLVVQEARFPLKAVVEPRTKGQAVTVSLRRGGAKPEPKDLRIEESVALAPGENVLELRAENEGALAGYEEFESERRSVVLVFQKKEAPTLLFTKVVPVALPGDPVTVEPGRPVTVAAGKVRVQGRIEAAEKLTLAMLGNRPLAGFKPDAAGRFDIDEEVALKPDGQELSFRAKSANSDEAAAGLRIVYRPPLPVFKLTGPDPNSVLYEGKDPREVEVTGLWAPPDGLAPADLQPFQVVLRVANGGRPVRQDGGREEVVIASDRLAPPKQPRQPGALAAKVRLQPGDNRIEVAVRNQWQDPRTEERHVLYRRPPRFVSAPRVSPPGEKPFTDVVAAVESASDLTRVECNDKEYAVKDVVSRAPGATAWTVTLRQVALSQGRNTIRLRVSNQDGPSLADGLATVEYNPPKPKRPPVIELVNRPETAVKDPDFTAQFVVRSEGSRIGRVELRDGARVLLTAKDLRQGEVGPGVFQAKGELGPVALREGPNVLRIVAENDGGTAEESFSVSYTPPPDRLEIDEPKSPVPDGKLVLTGHVSWSKPTSAAEVKRKLQGLRVYVNDGLQKEAPVYRDTGRPYRLDFSLPVVLDRPKGNRVVVDCPGLHADAEGRQQITVDCARPYVGPRTLHLLIVSVGGDRAEAGDKALALRALNALQARAVGTDKLKSTVFDRVVMHPFAKDQMLQVMSGYVTCEHVRDALESIRSQSGPNDVALIYWLGREAVDEKNELYLLTSESRPGRKLAHAAIPLQELLDFPKDVPGACALLLDVASDDARATASVTLAKASAKVAVLRYAWSKKDEVVPRLLMALEKASQEKQATSLKDLAEVAADRSRETQGGAATLEENLKDLPALATLVISRQP
jgi:hypothetical protein